MFQSRMKNHTWVLDYHINNIDMDQSITFYGSNQIFFSNIVPPKKDNVCAIIKNNNKKKYCAIMPERPSQDILCFALCVRHVD
jgi:hypothetical protein